MDSEPTSQVDVNYPILVTERNGDYTLRVKELILIVRSRDLEQGYREIVAKRLRFLQRAEEHGGLDELPKPDRHTLASALTWPAR